MTTPLPQQPPPGPDTPASRRSAWRWMAAMGAAGLVLLVATLGGGGALVCHKTTALPWLLQQVPGLQVHQVQGTLCEGPVRIAAIDWQLPGQSGRLQADNLLVEGPAWQWRPRSGVWLGLSLQGLSADRLTYTSGPPSGKSVQAPTDLRSPVDLDIARLAIAHLQVDTQAEVQDLQAHLTLGAEAGTQHRLQGLRLTVDLGTAQSPAPVQVQADLRINTTGALDLQTQWQAQRQAAPGWLAKLQANGPLRKLVVHADLQGLDTPTHQGNSPAPSLQADATVQPFSAWPVTTLQLQTRSLDLHALSPRLPQTSIQGTAQLVSSGMDQPALASVSLDNLQSGLWDAGRLPLQRLQVQATGELRHPDHLALNQLMLQLGGAAGGASDAGRITGQGLWQADRLNLDLRLQGVQPARLHRSAAALLLDGPLTLQVNGLPTSASGQVAHPTVTAKAAIVGRQQNGQGLPVQLQLQGQASADRLQLTQGDLIAGSAAAHVTLDAKALPTGWHLLGKLALDNFDPRPWWQGAEGSAWRRGPHRLDGQGDLDLTWHPQGGASGKPWDANQWLAAIQGQAGLHLAGSQLAGVALSAELTLQSTGAEGHFQGWAELGGNRLTLQGQRAGDATKDQWQAAIHAPVLAAMAPLGPLLAEWAPAAYNTWPQSGSIVGDVKATGRWPAVRSEGDLRVTALSTRLAQLQSATLNWRHGNTADAALTGQLLVSALTSGEQRLDKLQADIAGSLVDHTLRLQIDSPARPPAWTENLLGPAGTGTHLQAQAQGLLSGLGEGPLRYQLKGMRLQGGASSATGETRPWLAAQDLTADVQLTAAGQLQMLKLAPGRLQLLSTALNWRELEWNADAGHGRLDVRAELETIDVARLLSRLQPEMGWAGNLTLGGRIDVHSATRFDAEVVLERGTGDLTVTDDLGAVQALGLTDLRLALTAHNGLWQFAQGLAGKRIGTLSGAQVIQSTADRRWPAHDAPLQGVLDAHVADLGVWGTWVPPGWRLSGALDTHAQVTGRLNGPELQGQMLGRDLGLRNVLQGVSLAEGQLSIRLDGTRARIEQLAFKGGEGRLSITGGATLGENPQATLALVADHFKVLGRLDRRLVASGNADMLLTAQQLKLTGTATVDEGLFDIGRGEAPTLDNDVVVRRSAHAASAASAPSQPGSTAASLAPIPEPLRQAQVNISIGLGDKLQLKGQGVDTVLRGSLAITSPGGRLALNGTIHTHEGHYAAYGQKLDITRGDFVFTGPLDNPRLDVLAIRPNLDVLVGVNITGTALSPHIQLYSEPDMAEYYKLSWLVMGRSPDGLGSTDVALLQRAAFALLSGNSPGPTDKLMEALGITDISVRQTEGDTRDTIIGLGKQLSRRWYVGYERGVHATTGSWQLIYRIAQRFTLRAQSGTENAIDMIWSWRW